MEEKNNKKNEYSIGYSGEFLDDFPDFDSLEKSDKLSSSSTSGKSVPKSSNVSKAPTVSKSNASAANKAKAPVAKAPVKKAEYKPHVASDYGDDQPTDEKQNKTKSKADTDKKSSPLFVILCAVIALAIIGSATLSIFSVNKFLNSSQGNSDNVNNDDGSYNEYMTFIPSYEDTAYPKGITTDLSRAYSANNDIVGWLYVKGTNLNMPIVQYKNDNYYLRNNFFGSYTKYGTAYADFRCKRETLSKNTVIFGHNMPSGTHFYDVNRYEDIEWYKKNPVITYSTLYETYTFLIYTAFYSTVDGKDDGGYIFDYIYPNMGENSFKGYIEQVNQRALYKTPVDLKSTDKVITLSTCNHTYDSMCGQKVDSRLVVVGRLLRPGESADVNASSAKKNDNYRRPQIWYTRKGKTNPYANSRTWIPSSN